MRSRLLFTTIALIMAIAQGWAATPGETGFTGNGQALISTSVDALDFGDIEVGYTVTRTLVVTGTGLSGDINLALEGRGAMYYQVSPQTITAAAAAVGAIVTVKCNPISAFTRSADLILSSDGADDVVLPVTASAFLPEVMFVNKQTEEFTASVGQMVTHTGAIRFADAEIPPDPNTPVVMSYGEINLPFEAIGPGTIDGSYSLTVEGADAMQFSARLVKASAITKICTVAITYAPRALGTHEATLKAYCSKAGVPQVTINLHGEATSVLGDINNDSTLDVNDLTGIIKEVLIEGGNASRGDFDGDGVVTVDDVARFIAHLLSL